MPPVWLPKQPLSGTDIPPRCNGRTRTVLLTRRSGLSSESSGLFFVLTADAGSHQPPALLAQKINLLCPSKPFLYFNYIYINATTGFCQSFFHCFRSLIDTKSFCCTGSDTAHNFAIKNPSFFNNIYTIFMKFMNKMDYNCFRGMNMEAIQVFLTHSITPKFTIFFLSFC